MSEGNIAIIVDRLKSDSILYGPLVGDQYTGLARGGIWDRKLKRSGDGRTPEAFDGVGDTARLIRPSICVIDQGDRRHRQEPWIPTAYNQQIWVFYYAPATRSGKDTIADMRKRVYELLDHRASDGWMFVSDDGPIVFPHYVDRAGRRDSETFPEAVEDYQRFELTSRYANVV